MVYEPYIFIFYDGRDRDTALRVIHRINEGGYRTVVGEAGAEQDGEKLAKELLGSYCVLNLITHSYADSLECRQMVTYAQQKKKDMIDLYVEDAELPSGLEMQLRGGDSLRLSDGEEEFYKKLFALPVIETCNVKKTLTSKERTEIALKIDQYNTRELIPAAVMLLYPIIGPAVMHYTTVDYVGGLLFTILNILPLTAILLLAFSLARKMSRDSASFKLDNAMPIVLFIGLCAIPVTAIIDVFFIHSVENVILKILISLGINILSAIVASIVLIIASMKKGA